MKPDPDAKPLKFDDLKSVFSVDLLDALSNNRPPQEGALRSAAAICEDPDSFVATAAKRRRLINREIKKLQEERMKLSNEANVRITLRNACNTISAPIRRVPLDVIREITLHALDDHPSGAWKSSPMTLARVCSAWRIRALDHDSIIKYTRLVQKWFLRATYSPKSFFLYVDCGIPTGAPSHNLKLFLKAIGPSLTRLIHLGIGSHDWAELMMHFTNIELDVSELQKLDFLGQVSVGQLHSLTKLASINERITIFKDAKLLITLTATQEIRAFMPSFEFIPWNQLSDISIMEHFTQ
ncbi:hypothetical protein D9619_001310 [Psilocybe cf. subviscida]|uniref:F-box domain-containing protein n=1 Tax=Psilocybe cf. subviscida TaxID=2480587 RepID=A0A8H5F2K2_9AGAR|nr:hypothetical protein D9619_001310 [Psilocybe cf. subviscida]